MERSTSSLLEDDSAKFHRLVCPCRTSSHLWEVFFVVSLVFSPSSRWNVLDVLAIPSVSVVVVVVNCVSIVVDLISLIVAKVLFTDLCERLFSCLFCGMKCFFVLSKFNVRSIRWFSVEEILRRVVQRPDSILLWFVLQRFDHRCVRRSSLSFFWSLNTIWSSVLFHSLEWWWNIHYSNEKWSFPLLMNTVTRVSNLCHSIANPLRCPQLNL